MNLNSLTFVDCYALSNDPPKTGDWTMFVEAYKIRSPHNQEGAMQTGGPKRWQVVFKGIESLTNLEVSKNFQSDFSPGREGCEIYKMNSTNQKDGKIIVHIGSDYLNGDFVCQSVEVLQIS
jgi:hypothetical protein